MSNHIQKDSDHDGPFANSFRRNFLYVWSVAVVSVLFYVPVIPKLIPADVPLPFSMNIVVLLSIIQLVVVTALFAAAGAYLTPRIGFRARLGDVAIHQKDIWAVCKSQCYYGVPTGLAGAITAYFMAPDFIAYLNSYPFVFRLFGGLYEEVIMRWGLMTILVWILWRIFQKGTGIPKSWLVYSGILVSQILFAFSHIPALTHFGITDPALSVFTIFIVSLPWGWLFWRQGLESAFIAHSSFHAFVALLVAINI